MEHTEAPNFALSDQDGITRSLTDFAGRWVVLYFYPSDKTLNCTTEACNFRDEYRIISQFGNAQVIGINKASVKTHKKFSMQNHLNFPILSDTGHKVTSAYGSWRSVGAPFIDRPFGTRRNTFLINPDGIIMKSFLSVDPNNHAQEVIQALQDLQAAPAAQTV